jgi:hypothetical protein
MYLWCLTSLYSFWTCPVGPTHMCTYSMQIPTPGIVHWRCKESRHAKLAVNEACAWQALSWTWYWAMKHAKLNSPLCMRTLSTKLLQMLPSPE